MLMRTAAFVLSSVALVSPAGAQTPASLAALRFFGTGVGPPGQQDRVRIPIDDTLAGPDASSPCDLGSSSFTIDFWIRGVLADNASTSSGGDAEYFDFRWIEGNIVIDRDIFDGSSRDWGVSIAGGHVRFGTGRADAAPLDQEHTIEGGENVLDGSWRHIAVVREVASGRKSVYVDGVLDYQSPPNRSRDDISFPNDGAPGQQTPWGPFIVLAAEKHDAGAAYPSFNGFMDEVRFWSRALSAAEIARVRGYALVAGSPLALGLVGAYRFEEGSGTTVGDSSLAGSPPGLLIAGQPGNGEWVVRGQMPANAAPVVRCDGDADGDLAVSFADITSVLGNFGSSRPTTDGPGDADADGAVNFSDITRVLSSLGLSCP